MVKPVWAGAAGMQGVLEAAVETLHQAIPLWMVGCGLHVLDTSQSTEGSHRDEVN